MEAAGALRAKLDAYKIIAANSVIEKWHQTSLLVKARGAPKGLQLKCKALGVVFHDRYLCEDVRGRP